MVVGQRRKDLNEDHLTRSSDATTTKVTTMTK